MRQPVPRAGLQVRRARGGTSGYQDAEQGSRCGGGGGGGNAASIGAGRRESDAPAQRRPARREGAHDDGGGGGLPRGSQPAISGRGGSGTGSRSEEQHV
eukprot:5231745-Prymnesium_polylepis.1